MKAGTCGSRAIEAEEAGEAILTEPPALTVSTCGAGVKAIGAVVMPGYSRLRRAALRKANRPRAKRMAMAPTPRFMEPVS